MHESNALLAAWFFDFSSGRIKPIHFSLNPMQEVFELHVPRLGIKHAQAAQLRVQRLQSYRRRIAEVVRGGEIIKKKGG